MFEGISVASLRADAEQAQMRGEDDSPTVETVLGSKTAVRSDLARD